MTEAPTPEEIFSIAHRLSPVEDEFFLEIGDELDTSFHVYNFNYPKLKSAVTIWNNKQRIELQKYNDGTIRVISFNVALAIFSKMYLENRIST